MTTEPSKPTPPAPTREDLARYEAEAEAAYDAMYEVKSYGFKDLRDDALIALDRAIEIAERLGLPEEAGRLRKRRANIDGVYQSQFRGF